MKSAKLLLVGALGFFAFKLLRKKGTADKLQFFVYKVAVRFSGITPVLDITLGIHNPTSETLRIGGIVGDLYINNNYAATISGYQLTDVKSLGVSYFPISARLSVLGVVSEIIDIVQQVSSGGLSSLTNQVLGFKGYVNAEGLTIPLNFQYKVL